MADTLSTVPAANEEYKKQLLSAMASGGTAGAQAFESGQQALTTARGQSIDRAGQLASLIGGPESQGFEGLAAGQYDRRIGDLKAGQANFTENLAARGSAYDQYLNAVSAAVPLVRANTDRALALKQLELDAKGGGAGSDSWGDLSDSELRVRLGGAADNLYPGTSFAKDEKARALGAYLTQSGSAAPARISGLFPRTEPKPAKPVATLISKARLRDETELATVQKDPDYIKAKAQIETLLGTGTTKAELQAALQASLLSGTTKKDRSYRLLLAQYLDLFPTRALEE